MNAMLHTAMNCNNFRCILLVASECQRSQQTDTCKLAMHDACQSLSFQAHMASSIVSGIDAIADNLKD
jgi:hypothetical protein